MGWLGTLFTVLSPDSIISTNHSTLELYSSGRRDQLKGNGATLLTIITYSISLWTSVERFSCQGRD